MLLPNANAVGMVGKNMGKTGYVVIYREGEEYFLYENDIYSDAKEFALRLCSNIDDLIKEIIIQEMVDELKLKEKGIEVVFERNYKVRTKIDRKKIEFDRLYIPLSGKYAKLGAVIFLGDSKYGYGTMPPYVNKKQLSDVVNLYESLVKSEEFERAASRMEEMDSVDINLLKAGEVKSLQNNEISKSAEIFLSGIILESQEDTDVDPTLIHQIKKAKPQSIEIVLRRTRTQRFKTVSGEEEIKFFKKILVIVSQDSNISAAFLGTPSYTGRTLYKVIINDSALQKMRGLFLTR